MAEIIRINENTWRIEDGIVRFFFLTGSEKAMFIDSGDTGLDLKAVAAQIAESEPALKAAKLPLVLLNTHADPDHVAGNGAFPEFYMHPADEPHYRGDHPDGRVIPLSDGMEIDLGGRVLKIIHLPGHTPGSVAVLDTSRRVLISGDPIQEHGHIYMFGERRNMRDYAASLEKLEARTGEFDEIWPSHADIPLGTGVIRKLREGAGQILAGEVPGRDVEFFGQKIRVYDLGFTAFLCER